MARPAERLRLTGQRHVRHEKCSGYDPLRRQSGYIVAQHTGMLPIMTQHMQPASIMQDMQSQQQAIIEAIFISPLMHLKVTPISVISHVVDAIIMLQVQQGMPFIIITQLHMLPAII